MRLKCFTMVKDEIDIIEDWLRHTIDLFGPGNVYVLDNESTDGTESVLRQYGAAIWSKSVKAGADGPTKGRLMTDLMLEHRGDCDLLVPLDGDEFIGLQDSWDRDCVLAEFAKLDISRYGRFKFALTYQVIPSVEESPCPIRSLVDFTVTSYEFFGETYKDFAKTFYAANSFVSTDNGNHFGTSSQPAVYYSPLWIFHYHARSLNQYRQKILKGAAYTNYWAKYQNCGHWKQAYQAHLDGRFEAHFEATQRDLPRHRRISWPGERLRELDRSPQLPIRTGQPE